MKQIMYIGPGVKGIVSKNEVFTYLPETVIKRVTAIYEPAGQLFVSMDNIVKEKKDLHRAGSAMNLIYSRFEKILRR